MDTADTNYYLDPVANPSLLVKYNVGIGTTNPGADLHVYEDDADIARIYATGNSQGTGMVYVGQSTTYGGGIVYNGDDNPDLPFSTDQISLFRRTAGTDTEVMHWSHNNSHIYINDDLTVSGGNLYIGNDAEWRDNGTNIIYTPDSLDVDGYSYFDGARMDANLNLNNYEIDNINYLDMHAGEGYGLRFWSSDNYKISMGSSANYKYGWVADYSIKTQMNNDGDRGFTWGVIDAVPTASLDTEGYMTLAGDLRVNGGNIYWGDDEQIYRNAEDVLRTPDSFIIDGSVGIGTTSPSSLLHLKGINSSNPIELRIDSWYSAGGGFQSGRLSFWTADNTPTAWRPGYIESKDASNYTGRLDFYTNGTGSGQKLGSVLGMSIKNGNVGIGTTSPDAKLDILGTDNSANLRITSDYTGSGGRAPTLTIRGATDNNMKLELGYETTANISVITSVQEGTAYTPLVLQPIGGNVGIGTTDPPGTLSVVTSTSGTEDIVASFRTNALDLLQPDSSDITDPFTWHTGNAITWRIDSTDAMTIGPSGNVGIGTTDPGAKLEVTAAAKINSVTIPQSITVKLSDRDTGQKTNTAWEDMGHPSRSKVATEGYATVKLYTIRELEKYTGYFRL